MTTDGARDDWPAQYAEYDWQGPYDLADAVPGAEGVCWVASDEAAGWWAVVEGVWTDSGRLRPGVHWAVKRPGAGPVLMEGTTRYADAAVLDAERYIEELLEAAPAERLLARALEDPAP